MTEPKERQLEQDKISVVVDLAGKKVTFHLRMISMAEETALRQRYAGLKEDEKLEKEYQINADALNEFAIEPMTVDGSTWQQTKIYFKDPTPFKQRVAEYAIRGFLSKLAPDVSFL